MEWQKLKDRLKEISTSYTLIVNSILWLCGFWTCRNLFYIFLVYKRRLHSKFPRVKVGNCCILLQFLVLWIKIKRETFCLFDFHKKNEKKFSIFSENFMSCTLSISFLLTKRFFHKNIGSLYYMFFQMRIQLFRKWMLHEKHLIHH